MSDKKTNDRKIVFTVIFVNTSVCSLQCIVQVRNYNCWYEADVSLMSTN